MRAYEDWQLIIEEEKFLNSFTEDVSYGSSKSFQQILKKNERLIEKAEEQWAKEHTRGAERLIINEY